MASRRARSMISRSCSLPHVFLVGAAKAGTTSLARWLGAQPGLYLPALKEPHYFTPPPGRVPLSRPQPPVVRTLRRYHALYRRCSVGERGIDASTSYLCSSRAADAIRDAVGADVRVIGVLRDPVERAWSNYLNDVREGIEQRRFADAIAEEMRQPERCWGLDSVYLSGSRYADGLRRYVDTFGRERVLVVFFEDLMADPQRWLPVIADFVGIDEALRGSPELARENSYSVARNGTAQRLLAAGWLRRAARRLTPAALRMAMRRWLIVESTQRPPLEPALEQQLTDYFRADVGAVAELLGVTPPWARYADELASAQPAAIKRGTGP